jgi:hypothetical protein
MSGSHVWVTRFSIVRARPESGYLGTHIRGTPVPVPGLGAATPGRVILTLRATGSDRLLRRATPGCAAGRIHMPDTAVLAARKATVHKN